MSEFKARMPRGKPEKGEAFVVVSVKQNTGSRIEMTGTLTEELAMQLIRMTMREVNKRNEEAA